MKGQGRIISFSEPSFVDRILSGEKTQTCRPAWKGFKLPLGGFTTRKDVELILKPPIHKVGDIVQLSFKSRSRYLFFCKQCGTGSTSGNYDSVQKRYKQYCNICKDYIAVENLIPRGVFARAMIIETFEIIMRKEYDSDSHEDDFIIQKDGKDIQNNSEYTEIAKRDGFDSVEEFFKFFDEHHDLTNVKPLRTIRWELI